MKKLLELSNDVEYDRQLVNIGKKRVIFNVFSILFVLFIFYFYDVLDFGFVFTLFFSMFRIKFGGYHCKTAIRCLIFTFFVISVVAFIYNQMLINNRIVAILSGVILLKLIKENKMFKIIVSFLYVFFHAHFGFIAIFSFVYAYIVFQIFYVVKYKKMY